MSKETREAWKDRTAIVQSIVTVLALLVGGSWALYTFWHQRQDYPRLRITQHIAHLRLSGDYNLLLVDANFNNIGPTVLNLRKGYIQTLKVLPLDDSQKEKLANYAKLADSDKNLAKWWRDAAPPLHFDWADGEKLIEPGEMEYVHNEIVVPASVRSFLMVTYVSDPGEKTKESGWSAIDMYDLGAQLPATKETKRGIDGRR